MSACKSYRPGAVCADGFIQVPICSGMGGCPTCGHHSEEYMPYCLRETLPAHMSTDAGGPAFYREQKP